MRLLLDTHVAIWTQDAPDRLGSRALSLIETAEQVFVSAASLWEIAIKHALRRGRHDDMIHSAGDAHALFSQAGFMFLPINPDHAVAVDGLMRGHGDPFDRMLVAQAHAEPMQLLTHDSRLSDYGSFVILV